MSYRHRALRAFAMLAGASGLLGAGAAGAQPIKLRAPSNSLSLECDAGTNFSMHDGPWYERARNLIADATKFGPSGVVNQTFVFNPPFDDFDPEKLDGADVLLLNPVKIPVNRPEFMPFRTYAVGGVGFISFQNDALTFMADKSECIGENVANVTAAGSTTPVMNGPFGNVGASFATGWNCSFKNADPGVIELSTNSKGPNGLLLDLGLSSPGSARAVSFADEELWAGPFSQSGCGSQFLGVDSANERLFLNTLAYVAATGRDPIPDDVEGTGDSDGDGIPDYLDGDTDDDGILDLFEAGDRDPTTPPIDTDADGTPDYLDTDSDGDGIPDAVESPGNILQPPVDTDKDGTPDFQDSDSDDDGVADLTDNCRTVKNSDQSDLDQDGIGDACDPTPDAGTQPDASPDSGGWGGASGASQDDGGAAAAGDASTNPADRGSTESDSGCGCRTRSSGEHGWIVLAALALFGLRRKRQYVRL